MSNILLYSVNSCHVPVHWQVEFLGMVLGVHHTDLVDM